MSLYLISHTFRAFISNLTISGMEAKVSDCHCVYCGSFDPNMALNCDTARYCREDCMYSSEIETPDTSDRGEIVFYGKCAPVPHTPADVVHADGVSPLLQSRELVATLPLLFMTPVRNLIESEALIELVERMADKKVSLENGVGMYSVAFLNNLVAGLDKNNTRRIKCLAQAIGCLKALVRRNYGQAIPIKDKDNEDLLISAFCKAFCSSEIELKGDTPSEFDGPNQNHFTDYFSLWNLQNKITLVKSKPKSYEAVLTSICFKLSSFHSLNIHFNTATISWPHMTLASLRPQIDSLALPHAYKLLDANSQPLPWHTKLHTLPSAVVWISRLVADDGDDATCVDIGFDDDVEYVDDDADLVDGKSGSLLCHAADGGLQKVGVRLNLQVSGYAKASEILPFIEETIGAGFKPKRKKDKKGSSKKMINNGFKAGFIKKSDSDKTMFELVRSIHGSGYYEGKRFQFKLNTIWISHPPSGFDSRSEPSLSGKPSRQIVENLTYPENILDLWLPAKDSSTLLASVIPSVMPDILHIRLHKFSHDQIVKLMTFDIRDLWPKTKDMVYVYTLSSVVCVRCDILKVYVVEKCDGNDEESEINDEKSDEDDYQESDENGEHLKPVFMTSQGLTKPKHHESAEDLLGGIKLFSIENGTRKTTLHDIAADVISLYFERSAINND